MNYSHLIRPVLACISHSTSAPLAESTESTSDFQPGRPTQCLSTASPGRAENPRISGALGPLATKCCEKCRLVLVSIFFVLLHLAVPGQAAAETVYVMVRESKLRAKPDFFTPASGDVRYGDRLEVIDTNGAWLLVKSGGKQGHIHQSAVTEKKVVLKSKAGFGGGDTDPNDVVLAGKGFSAEVERQFAATHRNLNFSKVDAMERIRVSPKELSSFAADGKLGKREM